MRVSAFEISLAVERDLKGNYTRYNENTNILLVHLNIYTM